MKVTNYEFSEFEKSDDMAKGGMIAIICVNLTALLCAVIGFALGMYLTWSYAPAVGGEWWPYIRVGSTIIAGFISLKISGLVGYVVGIPVGVVVSMAYTRFLS